MASCSANFRALQQGPPEGEGGVCSCLRRGVGGLEPKSPGVCVRKINISSVNFILSHDEIRVWMGGGLAPPPPRPTHPQETLTCEANSRGGGGAGSGQ